MGEGGGDQVWGARERHGRSRACSGTNSGIFFWLECVNAILTFTLPYLFGHFMVLVCGIRHLPVAVVPPLPAPLSPITLTSCILVSRPLHGWCFHLSCFFLDIIFSSAVGSNYLEYFLRGNFMSVFALRNLNGHNRHIYIYMHGHGQNFKFFGLQKE